MKFEPQTVAPVQTFCAELRVFVIGDFENLALVFADFVRPQPQRQSQARITLKNFAKLENRRFGAAADENLLHLFFDFIEPFL